MTSPDGGPAFPTPGEQFITDANGRTGPQSLWGLQGDTGMSLRDWFAGQALMGMATIDLSYSNDTFDLEKARRAYALADAMLEVRGAADSSNPLVSALHALKTRIGRDIPDALSATEKEIELLYIIDLALGIKGSAA